MSLVSDILIRSLLHDSRFETTYRFCAFLFLLSSISWSFVTTHLLLTLVPQAYRDLACVHLGSKIVVTPYHLAGVDQSWVTLGSNALALIRSPPGLLDRSIEERFGPLLLGRRVHSRLRLSGHSGESERVSLSSRSRSDP
jgi:hypothetical protein